MASADTDGIASRTMSHGTVQVQWHSIVLETQVSTESNHHDTNILVAKGTVHTRLKEICA